MRLLAQPPLAKTHGTLTEVHITLHAEDEDAPAEPSIRADKRPAGTICSAQDSFAKIAAGQTQ